MLKESNRILQVQLIILDVENREQIENPPKSQETVAIVPAATTHNSNYNNYPLLLS